MATTRDLLEGVAGTLKAAGLVEWNADAVYAAGQTGVFMKRMPAAPDRVVVLTAVSRGDDPSMPLGQIMLQVRGRGRPNQPLDVDDLLDSIFAVLHGSTDLPFGDMTVIQCNRRITAPMGMDDAKRWERADQYYIDADYPATDNRPFGGSW